MSRFSDRTHGRGSFGEKTPTRNSSSTVCLLYPAPAAPSVSRVGPPAGGPLLPGLDDLTQPRVLIIPLAVEADALGRGPVLHIEALAHNLLRFGHVVVYPAHRRGEHGCPQRAGLLRGGHSDRHVEDVRQSLHDQRRPASDATEGDDLLDGQAFGREPLHDAPGPCLLY